MSVLVRGLHQDFPVPILWLQHGLSAGEPDLRASLLQRHSLLPVGVVMSGAPVASRGISVVPGGHGAVMGVGGLLVLGDRPAGGGGDELLVSVAEHYGRGATAVILTGNLSDGAQGVQAIKRRGGRVLVQEPASAKAASMPASAIATGCVDFILPVERLASAIVALTVAPGGAELLAVAPPSWAQMGS